MLHIESGPHRPRYCALIALLVLGVGVVSACGARKAELLTKAAADLKCSQDKLEIENRAGYVESVTGCGRESVYLYSPNAGGWVSPLGTAALELACDKRELNVTAIKEKPVQIGMSEHGPMIGYIYVAEVTGCGKSAVYLSNMGTGSWTSPNERAAFEMDCTKGDISTRLIDDNTVGVQACGQKGVYLIVVGSDGAKWVLESKTQPAARGGEDKDGT